MAAVSFDKPNLELRTVRFYFADKGESAVKITWNKEVKRGATVSPKQILGYIVWRSSNPEAFRAPGACRGVITRRTRSVAVERLRREPVMLLRLKR